MIFTVSALGKLDFDRCISHHLLILGQEYGGNYGGSDDYYRADDDAYY